MRTLKRGLQARMGCREGFLEWEGPCCVQVAGGGRTRKGVV